MSYAIEMNNITKIFTGIKANDNVTLKLKKGTIHALLGENGAGKSTLMSILFGLYQSDEGTIKVLGKEVEISSPNKATELGIGMVHQHFKLVECFTVLENIVLGVEEKKSMGRIDYNFSRKKILEISEKYGLAVNLDKKIENLTVGAQQKVEILKMLYRDANILIFDEPTAVLTPQEILGLLEIMKKLTEEGKSIIVITHKLDEIKKIASECTILRKGKGIGTVIVEEQTVQQLADLMVGRAVNFKIDKKDVQPKEVVLKIENIKKINHQGVIKLKGISFEVKAGEVVGIAGIEGNGQTELINSISGLDKDFEGKIILSEKNITQKSIRDRTLEGVGHIPEDRHKHGLVLEYTLEENLILQSYFTKEFSEKGILKKSDIRKQSDKLIDNFDIRSGKRGKSVVRDMSGGNQQKAIIAREMAREPKLLIASQPTRGLDVGAIEFIHKEIIKARDLDKGILLVSSELDEILNISDRVLVIFEGEIVKELLTKDTNKEEIGLYMAGSKKE